MASLVEVSTSRTCRLQPEHVVGRAPICALRLTPRYVSAQHALIRWTGQLWEIKDLGSTNGTFLDGHRIEPGQAVTMTKGACVTFGHSDEAWQLADNEPPCVMVVPFDAGEPMLLSGDLLALPSADDPRVTIYRDVAAGWVLEQPDESTQPIQNGHVFEAAGRWWWFCCAEDASLKNYATAPTEVLVRNLELFFEVSRNEEYVALSMRCRGRTVTMGARARYFLLLTLARRRLAEQEAGLPDGECGWTCPDDWPHDRSMAPAQVALDVYRIRHAFALAGVADFANIIERRPRTRELRIGTSKVQIQMA